MAVDFDVVVIGAGPGGETVAGRLLEAGRRVALVERELVGGECAYWACVPSKTLLRSPEVRAEAAAVAGVSEPAHEWSALRDYRDHMIRGLDDTAQVRGYREQGATVLRAEARITGRDPWVVEAGGERLTAANVVVATGSEAVRPPVDGLDGVEVWTNREATTLREIPERALLIGGSAVGVELGQFLARMGCSVVLVQRGPRLLGREEPRLGELAAERLRGDGVEVRTGCQVSSVRREGDGTVAELDDGSAVRTDVVVLGAGRRPRTGGLGLEGGGVELGGSGAPVVDERCRVTGDGLWAIGDVTGISQFTHVAQYHGRIVADVLLGGSRRADHTGIPRVVFSHPEIAAVGVTAAGAREEGIETAACEFDLTASLARPWTFETEPTGTLGLLADRRRRVLIGAWAMAPLAGEWIHQAALAIRAGIPIDTLLDGVAQFPTYSESLVRGLERLEL
ncbi:NAD(P)/FAD-dependent oxidoreductase [Streptomyces sp. ST2-7A]|uniref:dihydrolipoyl dehydrogenase family protein n=1 Tax=Streptomyces sp. ST2-7A TaxID=2907214 RepID=UPI001F220232|nr:NAD(P)/FAD-dependent oxidoreductase [Streptomyces sp. ST2-7A]MCE7079470.1 NAD(P)/FAD-dependent oxidoreductase [Streptomyces sp. ST2-7A]